MLTTGFAVDGTIITAVDVKSLASAAGASASVAFSSAFHWSRNWRKRLLLSVSDGVDVEEDVDGFSEVDESLSAAALD